MKFLVIICFSIIVYPFFSQGSFAPAPGTIGSSAIHKDSSVFVAWASSCVIQRGPQQVSNSGSPLASAGDDYMATGKSGVYGTVSLGDGGIATLTFDLLIVNGTGWDFAVFENGFSDNFLELAFVEVSSDGINFFRFPATSEIQDTLQTDGFGSSDPTEINNLAGKYRAQYGTPFDLEELIGTNGLDINHITHVRVIDVIGSISENYASYDQYGNAINDPYPTDFPAGGFDLDAVGVINHDISASISTSNKDFKLYPTLTSDLINLTSHSILGEICIYSIDGTLINKLQSNDYSLTIDVNFLESGIYILNTNGINLQFIKY